MAEDTHVAEAEWLQDHEGFMSIGPMRNYRTDAKGVIVFQDHEGDKNTGQRYRKREDLAGFRVGNAVRPMPDKTPLHVALRAGQGREVRRARDPKGG